MCQGIEVYDGRIWRRRVAIAMPHSSVMADDKPELMVSDAAAWRAWLDDHYEDGRGVWLVVVKAGKSAPTTLTYDDALEEALCYGWIDGQARSRDEATFRQSFTPRRPRSRWSQRNVDIVSRLEAAGKMHPAGTAEVERAQADGRWAAASAVAADAPTPADLADALSKNPRAAAMFEILTKSNRSALLRRIEEAKRAETRTRRIEESVTMLSRGETPYPQKRALGDTGKGQAT